jgi:hypothetical protein
MRYMAYGLWQWRCRRHGQFFFWQQSRFRRVPPFHKFESEYGEKQCPFEVFADYSKKALDDAAR